MAGRRYTEPRMFEYVMEHLEMPGWAGKDAGRVDHGDVFVIGADRAGASRCDACGRDLTGWDAVWHSYRSGRSTCYTGCPTGDGRRVYRFEE